MKNEHIKSFCLFWWRTCLKTLPIILILLSLPLMKNITSSQSGSQILIGSFVMFVVLVGYLNVLTLLGYSCIHPVSSIRLTYIMLPMKRKERILYWDLGILVHFLLMVSIEIFLIHLVGSHISFYFACLFIVSLLLSYFVASIIHRHNSLKVESRWYYLLMWLGVTHGLTFQVVIPFYLQVVMCALGAVAMIWFMWLEKGKSVNKKRGSHSYGKWIDQTLGLFSMSSMYKDDQTQNKVFLKNFLVIILISMFTGNLMGKWSELKLFFPLNVFLIYMSVMIFLGNDRVSKIIPIPLSVSLRSLTLVVLAQGLFCYSVAYLLNIIHPVIGLPSFVMGISLVQWITMFINIMVIQLVILGCCLFLMGIDGRFLKSVLEVAGLFIVGIILSSNKLDIVDILLAKPNAITGFLIVAALILGVIGIFQTRRGCRVPTCC